MRDRTIRDVIIRASVAGFTLALSAVQFGAASPASARANTPDHGPTADGYQVTRIFVPTGMTTDQGYPLTKPDDIVRSGDRLFVAFQNGVGADGSKAPNGNPKSTVVELTPDGKLLNHWDLIGKIDGLGVDPALQAVVATVNEDGGSSLYTIHSGGEDSIITHYCYDKRPLPHGGGTDSIAFYDGKLIISASAPSATPARAPAVYIATLTPDQPASCPGTGTATGTAVLTNGFSDAAAATPANQGAPSRLSLTDPDSSTVVPESALRFGGTFMLDSQGDRQQIYTTDPAAGSDLRVLQLSQPVNDTAFVTSAEGALYATDPSTNSVDRIDGPLQVGQVVVAVTPDTAPNHLGQLNLGTGEVTALTLSAPLHPAGLVFAASDEAGGGHGPESAGRGRAG